jgi:hypothetical protein
MFEIAGLFPDRVVAERSVVPQSGKTCTQDRDAAYKEQAQ